jgi:excisionase family DNA binding protein
MRRLPLIFHVGEQLSANLPATKVIMKGLGWRFGYLTSTRQIVQSSNVVSTINQPAFTFEPFISAVEAGELLGIHPVTVLRWAREGRVPHRRLGRKIKFRKSELDKWQETLYTESAVRVARPQGEGT